LSFFLWRFAEYSCWISLGTSACHSESKLQSQIGHRYSILCLLLAHLSIKDSISVPMVSLIEMLCCKLNIFSHTQWRINLLHWTLISVFNVFCSGLGSTQS
jgi:hypothetical protein